MSPCGEPAESRKLDFFLDYISSSSNLDLRGRGGGRSTSNIKGNDAVERSTSALGCLASDLCASARREHPCTRMHDRAVTATFASLHGSPWSSDVYGFCFAYSHQIVALPKARWNLRSTLYRARYRYAPEATSLPRRLAGSHHSIPTVKPCASLVCLESAQANMTAEEPLAEHPLTCRSQPGVARASDVVKMWLP